MRIACKKLTLMGFLTSPLVKVIVFIAVVIGMMWIFNLDRIDEALSAGYSLEEVK